jgi:hypothetical protein
MSDERERVFQEWQALCAAARATHKEGPGGAAACICGAPGGGSAACNMLRHFKVLVEAVPARRLPAVWRRELELLRSVL